MIVSFTGAQSTGKTTLLNEMRKWKSLSDYYFVDEITRSVKRAGMKINEEGDDATQRAIMKAHISNIRKGSNLILDRCALDGVVYTDYLYRHNRVSLSTLRLATNVFKDLLPEYDVIFYLKPEFAIEDDGVRSSSISFRDEISDIFEDYIKKFNLIESSLIVELKGTVKDRLDKIRDIMDVV